MNRNKLPAKPHSHRGNQRFLFFEPRSPPCEAATMVFMFCSFLEDLNKEFQNLYGQEVARCERPYAFIKFGVLG